MALPGPKELLKQVADLLDGITEPARAIVETIGLPAPPRASEVVEGLPDLPAPPLPFPFSPFSPGEEGKKEEAEVEVGQGQLGVVEKIEMEYQAPTTVKLREV